MDKDTISAIRFWSQKGVKIECSPYRIYEVGEEPYIQFDSYNPDDEVLPEENTSFFIVNTNKTYMPDAWKDMLKTGKASAYYGRKNSVCRISKGSHVFLYHTGVGVIASGIATSNYSAMACGDDENEEFYIPLKFRWVLSDESQWDALAPKSMGDQ